MPGLPPTPVGVVQLKWLHGVDATSGISYSTRHRYTGSAPNTAALVGLATAAAASWDATMPGMLNTNSTLQEVEAIDLANPGTPLGVFADGTIGTRTGVIPSIATCAVVDQGIARRFRGARPKCFTPYGCETDVVTGNTWSNTFLAALLAAWDAFMADVNAAAAGGTVLAGTVGVSYFQGFTVVTSPTTHRARNVPTLRATPLVTDVLGYRIMPRLGSQRRRLKLA